MINLKGVDKKTWIRIVGLILILANQISVSFFDFRLVPFSDAEIYDGVSQVLSILAVVVGAWYNTSLTTEAQLADEQLKQMKGVKK